MISLLLSKKGIYLLLAIVFVLGFMGLRVFFINEGRRLCQQAVEQATAKEIARIKDVNLKALQNANVILRQLQDDQDDAQEKIDDLEAQNEMEHNSSCLSPNRLQRLNQR